MWEKPELLTIIHRKESAGDRMVAIRGSLIGGSKGEGAPHPADAGIVFQYVNSPGGRGSGGDSAIGAYKVVKGGICGGGSRESVITHRSIPWNDQENRLIAVRSRALDRELVRGRDLDACAVERCAIDAGRYRIGGSSPGQRGRIRDMREDAGSDGL